MLDLTGLPNSCSHEHWGSLDAFGKESEGFRADVVAGATPQRDTGLLDILLDPYFRGWLAQAGDKPDEWARAAGVTSFREWAQKDPAEACAALAPALERQRLTGTYQCIRRGLIALYDVDISVNFEGALRDLDEAVAGRYRKPFTWYRIAMTKAEFSHLIRPVHPEFYLGYSDSDSAQEERPITSTVMRIDPLLALSGSDNARRDALAETVGVEPGDAKSWREFIARIFLAAEKHGAVGIKQLQAYRRPLAFPECEDGHVRWSGDLERDEVRVFQNWVLHECCCQADRRGWPHQIHVGTHNIEQSSPMPLKSLAEKYPRMKIVQLHCWPFIREAGWLAKHCPNVYIDTCWEPILNPQFYRESLSEWLNYVPGHKIMSGHDATSVEMAAGSAVFTREMLVAVLYDRTRGLGLSEKDLRRQAAAILHNNAVAVYGIGEAYADGA
jgi:predicted TIM-barrel fold metal-dependent hydrolase